MGLLDLVPEIGDRPSAQPLALGGIEKILTHLDAKATASEATRRPPCREPPQRLLFD